MRPSRSAAVTTDSTCAASRSTSAGHSCGRSWLAIAISTTSDGCRRSPSTARISPTGPRCDVGGAVISTTTIWPALRALLLSRLDHHVVVEATIVRRHQGHAVVDHHPANQPRRTPLQHFGDRALLAAATVDADHAGQHAVAMHDRAHLLRRQVQILAALVRAQETVAFGIGQHAAGNQVELLRGRITTATTQQQLAIAHHRRETFAQRFQVGLFVDAECVGNACLGQQFAAFFEQGENRLAAGDRARITLRLAIGMGIAHGASGGLVALVRRGYRTRRPPGGLLRGMRVLGMAGLGGSFSGHSVSL